MHKIDSKIKMSNIHLKSLFNGDLLNIISLAFCCLFELIFKLAVVFRLSYELTLENS